MTLSSFKRSSLTNNVRYENMLVGNAAFIPNSYESIATTTVGSGGVSSVTFSSIPSTYTHLQIRALARTSFNNVNDQVKMKINSAGFTSYASHWLVGDGSTATANNSFDDSVIKLGDIAGTLASASTFGAFVIDFLDYANPNKFKTTRQLGGVDRNGSGLVSFYSGLYKATTAISSISFTPYDGATFSEYSSFALYGIKGA